ncbi:hypothetical protein [Natrialba taiwanensis]|uniref:Uncharacterized protein n=1 Tax=Natrialba taiwanensis DSM 12281 TaxID=1230458 RepID=M0A6R4_9EURY|nr:hypothetical protein [Natrialba taiwanensis]ELY94460.1 hypothetical protein C484_05777 [Natrialba taiwanensis DSM 12281]
MGSYVSGVGSCILGLVVSLLHLSPPYAIQRIVDGTWWWFPQLEPVSHTLILYNSVVGAATFALGVVGIFALGYRAGAELEFSADARRLALVVGLGSVIGYALPVIAVVVLSVVDGGTALGGVRMSLSLSLLQVTGQTIGFGIQSALIGFAGAAFAHQSANSDRRTAVDV